MGREKRSLNPVESYRRSQKRKLAQKKRTVRKENLARYPSAQRDPSTLLIEIERLRQLESEERLDGPGRMKRKHLEEQFVALSKEREKLGLPNMYLSEFDPEVYRSRASEPGDKNFSQPDKNGISANAGLENIPMPDDLPFDNGISGLPPYLNHLLADSSQDLEAISTLKHKPPALVITGEPKISRESLLEVQVDQFLNEISL